MGVLRFGLRNPRGTILGPLLPSTVPGMDLRRALGDRARLHNGKHYVRHPYIQGQRAPRIQARHPVSGQGERRISIRIGGPPKFAEALDLGSPMPAGSVRHQVLLRRRALLPEV